MLEFILIDKSRNLYITKDKVRNPPEFASSYCTKSDKDGWCFDQANEIWYKYDKRLQAILAINDEGVNKFVDHMGIIQLSNKTVY